MTWGQKKAIYRE